VAALLEQLARQQCRQQEEASRQRAGADEQALIPSPPRLRVPELPRQGQRHRDGDATERQAAQ